MFSGGSSGLLVACAVVTLGCGARTGLGEEGDGGAGGAGASTAGTQVGSSAQSTTMSVSTVSGTSSVVSTSSSVSSASTTTASTSVSTTVSTTTGPICTSNEECDDGVDCTFDACEPQGCTHVAIDSACDDGVFCTIDTCDGFTGCVNEPTDDVCDDGIACTLDTCNLAFDACESAPCDGLCDDQIFCDGVERCDAAVGCVDGPPACDTGLACAGGACTESTDSCSLVFPLGCPAPDVHILVTDATGALWDVSPFASPGEVLIAPPSSGPHLDIAVLGSRWFTADSFAIRELVPFTNVVLATLPFGGPNSLAAGPDGMLYAASNPVYRIDPDDGSSQQIGSLPIGHNSSGDIAFLGERMFVSTDSGCGGALVEVDITTGQSTVLGGDGLGCVYGLATVGGVLYVINCDGKIGSFDPDTGEVRIFAETTVEAFGADALP